MKRLPMLDPIAEIRRLYFSTTRGTIERDFQTALDLLKSIATDEERSRATVFMHGLAQMRADWSGRVPRAPGAAKPPPPPQPRKAGSANDREGRPAKSGRARGRQTAAKDVESD